MRIGIDFDNTIICYDHVFTWLAKTMSHVSEDFQGNKQSLRDFILMQEEGETIWQKLQGQVYGKLIDKAHLYPGFLDFLKTAATQNDLSFFIVSHKTEYGHFDEAKINLRHAAMDWLIKQGITKYIPVESIYFEETRESKISRIRSLECSHFIDDLREVLEMPNFPAKTRRLLFAMQNSATHAQIEHFTNWEEITRAIFPAA